MNHYRRRAVKLSSGSLVFGILVFGGVSFSEQSLELFPGLGADIVAQGQMALASMSAQQNVAVDWKQQAVSNLAIQLSDFEFEQMFAEVEPCVPNQDANDTPLTQVMREDTISNKLSGQQLAGQP